MKIALVVLGFAIVVTAALLFGRSMNAGVERELRDEPHGERAGKVMLLTLPSGKSIPVNYLLEESTVYAGADFPWWRELRGEGGPVTVLIRGETRRGHARAVEDDAVLRTSVFRRLRPTAPAWTGTLVVIALEEESTP